MSKDKIDIVDIFAKIKEAKSIEDIKNIRKIDSEFNFKKYPPIKFTISKEDIDKLISQGIINGNSVNGNGGELITEEGKLTEKINDPLTKLLYAMVWKQGDLIKFKHIINGIRFTEEDITQENAEIFFQFGKSLANPQKEPIVDKNILEAYKAFYEASENTNKPLSKKKIEIISSYKDWLKDNLTQELKQDSEHLYYIDKLLFVIGKKIK